MRKLKKQKGFTLIESLAAAGLFLIISTFTASSITQYIRMIHQYEERGEAVMATQRVLDEIRVTDPTTMPTGGQVSYTNVTQGTRTYRIEATYCPSGTTYCTSNNVRHIRGAAYLNGTKLYEVDTLYSQLR